MGQGAYTAQMQILAEELEVDPSTVTVKPAPPDEPLYANPLLGGQITGGSASLRGAWITLRTAGACARLMLVEAAARQWGVAVESCTAANGTVTHAASGRTLTYGALATAAAQLSVPQAPALKKPGSFKVVGKPTPRVDTPAKVTGEAKFGIDVRVPGMRYAFVAACPMFGGTLASIDDSAALKVPGVQQVVRIEDALAVVARNSWAARKGLAALRVTWNDGPNANPRHRRAHCRARCRAGAAGLIATNTGDGRRCRGRRGQPLPGGFPPAHPRPRRAGAAELHRACARWRLRDMARQPGCWAAPRRRQPMRSACRSKRWWRTIICSAAASAGGWRPTMSARR